LTRTKGHSSLSVQPLPQCHPVQTWPGMLDAGSWAKLRLTLLVHTLCKTIHTPVLIRPSHWADCRLGLLSHRTSSQQLNRPACQLHSNLPELVYKPLFFFLWTSLRYFGILQALYIIFSATLHGFSKRRRRAGWQLRTAGYVIILML